MAHGRIGGVGGARGSSGAQGGNALLTGIVEILSELVESSVAPKDFSAMRAALKSNQQSAGQQVRPPGGGAGAGSASDEDDAKSNQALIESLLQLTLLFLKMLTGSANDDSDSGSGSGSGGSGGGVSATPAAARAAGQLFGSSKSTKHPGSGGVGSAGPLGGSSGQPVKPSPAAGAGGATPAPGAASGSGQTGALTADQSQAAAVSTAQRLQADFGFTKEQAAGIVGNLYHESAGMNANINEIGSGPASTTYGAPNSSQFGYGLAQWTGSRKTDYLNFAAAHGMDPASPEAGYQFLKNELQGSESQAIAAVKATSTAADAATAFRSSYERATSPVDSARIADANQILAWLG